MRYLLGFLVTVGLVVLIIVLLLTGGGDKQQNSTKTLRLSDYFYSANAVASYTVDGPIVDDQNHNTIRVSVSQSRVTAVVYHGYEQSEIARKEYPNNSKAFAVFMQSLNKAGFTKGNNEKSMQDERGYCPSGQRTIYQLEDGNESLMRYWHASCGQGTFKGVLDTVEYLFREQIPDTDRSALLRVNNENVNVSF